MPRFYRPKQACQTLGMGMTKLYQLIGAGILDARKDGSMTLITVESVDRYADSRPKADIRTGQKGRYVRRHRLFAESLPRSSDHAR